MSYLRMVDEIQQRGFSNPAISDKGTRLELLVAEAGDDLLDFAVPTEEAGGFGNRVAVCERISRHCPRRPHYDPLRNTRGPHTLIYGTGSLGNRSLIGVSSSRTDVAPVERPDRTRALRGPREHSLERTVATAWHIITPLFETQGGWFDMTTVPEAANMPPTPWQTEILAPGIWAGAVPRIWRTLSCSAYMPYMPECM
jgi:hypothetical protein